MSDGTLFAVSDLHVNHRDNRRIVEGLRAQSANDWLIVCGDVAERPADIEWALCLLRERFATVVWVPGNHELLSHGDGVSDLRGEHRYRHLVELCSRMDVITPEHDYPIWEGARGPVRVAPLFLLYDYTFGSNVGSTIEESLGRAYEAGVVCSDEFLLHPDPFPSRQSWCDARLRDTVARLEAEDRDIPTVLVNHYPLIVEPTRMLRYPEFAQWCGTVRTRDWHRRFRAAAVVYGHLHIPCTAWYDGVRFEEVSLGYPRERRHRHNWEYSPRRIWPWESGA